jgi:hypothetical protein
VQRDPESRFFSGLSALQQMIDTRFRGNDGKRFHVILKEARCNRHQLIGKNFPNFLYRRLDCEVGQNHSG